jgi:hypothetical protein
VYVAKRQKYNKEEQAKQETSMKQVASRALLDTEDGGNVFDRIFPSIFDGLCGVMSHKILNSS